MPEEQKSLVDVGMKGLLFPIKVISRSNPEGQDTIAEISVLTRIDARNEADGLVYTTEKTLADLGDRVDPQSQEHARSAIAQLKQAMAGDDPGQIKTLAGELSAINQGLAQTAAGQQAGPAPGGAGQDQAASGSARANSDDDIIDAEYQDVA